MTNETDPEKDIYYEAIAIQDPQRRAAYLDVVCQQDPELRKGVQALLDADDEAGTFLDGSAMDSVLDAPDSTEDSPSLVEQVGETIGRYKLLEEIGEGGFGVVYMADQLEPLQRRVALKIIKVGMDTKQVIARFEAERQALALMEHPNIAKVLDAGTTETGRPYFVMELIHGIPVTEYCDDRSLTTEERLKIFCEICSAIQHAHQKGIIHRDIKPSNILVSTNGDRPVPKVIDFGIAKATQGRLTDKTLFTQFRQFIGTPAYMSPEQAQMSAVDVDTRSDIYSLGVLLYELLTGTTPFDSKELLNAGYDEICRRIREEEVPTPSKRLSSLQQQELKTLASHRRVDPAQLPTMIRGDLDWIVMKAVEKDRTHRYATANAFAQDIEHHLNGEPVTAVPPTTSYLVRKFIRRNRVLLTTAGIIAATLLVATIVSTGLAFLLAEQVKRAEESELQIKRHLYISEMAAAKRDFDQFYTRDAVNIVNKYIPASDEPDFRGFEWRWLWNQCNQELFQLRGHTAVLRDMRFSPDGKWLATGAKDGTARLWNLETRQEVWSHEGGKYCNGVDISSDGKLLLTFFWIHPNPEELPNTILWDLTTPESPTEVARFNGGTTGLRFAPDGQTFFSGGAQKDLSGNTVREFKKAGTTRQAISPNGNTFVWLNVEGNGQIVDVPSGDSHDLPRHIGYPDVHTKGIAISPINDDLIATGCIELGARIWNRSGESIHEFPETRGYPVSMIDFSKDGDLLAVRQYVGTIRIFETKSWNEVAVVRPPQPGNTVAFSPDDNNLLVAAGEDGVIRAWRVTPNDPVDAVLDHPRQILSLEFSPDGRVLAAGMWDGSVRFWDVRSKEPMFTTPGKREVYGIDFINLFDFVAFSPDSGFAAIIGAESVVSVWDLDRKREVDSVPSAEGSRYWTVEFSSDGSRLYAGSQQGGDLEVFEWNSRLPRLTRLSEHSGTWGRNISVSPDDLLLATAQGDSVAIWSLGEMRPTQTLPTPPGYEDMVNVSFSPDGSILAVCGKQLVLWDVALREVIAQFPTGAPMRYMSWSSDGSRLAVSDYGAKTKLWDVQSQQVVATFAGTVCAFSPDGTILAVNSDPPHLTVRPEATRQVTLHYAPPLEEIDRRLKAMGQAESR